MLTPLDEADVRRAVRRLAARRRRGDRGVLPVLVPQSRARAARGAHHRRGSAARARLAVLDRAAGDPRISAPVDDRDRRLCRPARSSAIWCGSAERLAAARRHDAAALSDAVERRPDAASRSGARHPNQTLLSGPAAGVIAGTALADAHRRRHVVTFDMGGTSTDISVIVDGRVLETTEGEIAGQDIGTPMLKVRTLGAGGGTIAAIGKDGLLKVGPQQRRRRARARLLWQGRHRADRDRREPGAGRACRARRCSPARLRLDEEAARRALENASARRSASTRSPRPRASCASSIRRWPSICAWRLQEQGQDPRKFALVAFGGAGPLHAASLARSVGIPTVLVPLYPGINCAMGMLQTAVRHSYLRSEMGVLSRFPVARMAALFAALEEEALAEAREEGFARERGAADAAPRSALSASGLHARRRMPGRARGRADKAALKRGVRRAARPGLWPVGAARGCRDRDLPRPGRDRRAAPRAEASAAGRRQPSARAVTGERPLFDLERDRFVPAADL